MDNKTLGLKYNAEMMDATLSDMLIHACINTDNQLIFFYDSSCQYCRDTGRSTGAYTIFYQSGPIDHATHVPGKVDQ